MNNQTGVNVVSLNTEITSFISENDFVTKRTPFSRCVKPLINPSIESERLASDLSSQREVFESVFERF